MDSTNCRNCGNCQHSYALWDSESQKLKTICVGCSGRMPDGGMRMISKTVNWTDAPCENYTPWAIVAESGDDADD